MPLSRSAQGLKRDAEVVLRRGPLERHALAAELIEGGAVGGHRLVEALRGALPFAQGLKRGAECHEQGGTVLSSTDCGAVEQTRELFRGVLQPFLQHPTAHFGVRERATAVNATAVSWAWRSSWKSTPSVTSSNW